MRRLNFSYSPAAVEQAAGDMRERVRPYVKRHFPRLAEGLVDRNCLELDYAQAAEGLCGCCLGLDMCSELLNTAGMAVGLELLPDGYVRQFFYRCRFHGKGGGSYGKHGMAGG
ncbi:MAG: hypothetical protein P4N59_17665 [Negativicutes bacterium]|nr:hypothetical protein [Negativicutes bacterium]